MRRRNVRTSDVDVDVDDDLHCRAKIVTFTFACHARDLISRLRRLGLFGPSDGE